MTEGIEEVRSPSLGLMALIIRSTLKGKKYNFPTSQDLTLQLGINFYTAGETIASHYHPPRARQFTATQEFIMVSEGEVLVQLYDEKNLPYYKTLLKKGDSALLLAGGHGFQIMRDAKITEVKLGPYDEAKDKVRF